MYTPAVLIRRSNRQHVALRFVIFSHSSPASVSPGHFLGLLLVQENGSQDSGVEFVTGFPPASLTSAGYSVTFFERN